MNSIPRRARSTNPSWDKPGGAVRRTARTTYEVAASGPSTDMRAPAPCRSHRRTRGCRRPVDARRERAGADGLAFHTAQAQQPLRDLLSTGG